MKRLPALPEFCPNASCRFHERSRALTERWYTRFGSFHTAARGPIQRYRCRSCGRTCSTQTFSVHYWTHSDTDLVWLLQQLYGCGGLRQMGRFLGVSYRVVQNRIRRLARNALAVMDEALSELELREDITLDGFATFTRSQYHPADITHLTGADSQFIYAVVHTTLRRSGAMRPAQRLRRALIDTVWRPLRGVRDDCRALLTDLAEIIDRSSRRRTVTLSTDRHRAYPQALARVKLLAEALRAGRLVHRRVSSRAARTRANPLFSVNYVDRQLRKNLAEHVRETVRQGREINCQMERMAIFTVLHNFLTPHREHAHADARYSERHASVAGIAAETVRWHLKRFVSHRHLWTHTRTGHEWIRRIWHHDYWNPPAVTLRRGRIDVHPVALPPGAVAFHLVT
jgi:transposase-like protein